MIPILVLKTENKVIYNKSNLNCKTFFEEFSCDTCSCTKIILEKTMKYALEFNKEGLQKINLLYVNTQKGMWDSIN